MLYGKTCYGWGGKPQYAPDSYIGMFCYIPIFLTTYQTPFKTQHGGCRKMGGGEEGWDRWSVMEQPNVNGICYCLTVSRAIKVYHPQTFKFLWNGEGRMELENSNIKNFTPFKDCLSRVVDSGGFDPDPIFEQNGILIRIQKTGYGRKNSPFIFSLYIICYIYTLIF